MRNILSRLLFISALVFMLISVSRIYPALGAFTDKDAEEARIALERLGRVYVSANDVLKLANEIDPSTKLPYADTLSLLILASNVQRHLESQDYGKLLAESASFVAKKAVGNAYPFAAPFLTLGELYYGLFKKIAGIPQHFENEFFKFQINKYLTLREAYDAQSVRDFALDSPLGFADDRAKGYFFSSGMGGSTSTQINLALRLRDSGITPETIFELGERLWAVHRKLSSLPNDRSVSELVQRIKAGTPTQRGVVETSGANDYLLASKRGAKWVYTVKQEFQTTTSRLGQPSKVTKEESGTLTITNEGEQEFEGLRAILFVSNYQFRFGSYSRNSYYRDSPEGIIVVGSEFIEPTKPPRKTKHAPPLLYIKNSPVVGTKWRTSNSTKSVVGQESVKVPAGQFDAIKLVTEGDSGTTTTEWWVRGVGLVKRSQSGPHTHMEGELINYSIPGEASVLAKRQPNQKDQTGSGGKVQDKSLGAQTETAQPRSAVAFSMIRCDEVISYRHVRGDVPPQIDLSVDETTKSILAQAAQFAQLNCPKDPDKPPPQANIHPRDWLHGEQWRRKWFQTNFPNLIGRSLANIDVYLYQESVGRSVESQSQARAPQSRNVTKDYKVHARNYETYQLNWREYTNRPLEARLRVEAEKQRGEEQARREAAFKTEQARIAREKADREAARQVRWNDFVRRHGVQEMINANALTVNPFVYQGKTVAIHTHFERMVSPDTGLFADGTIMVSGLPRDLFRARSIVVLAGRVTGTTGQTPILRFVGAHFCKDYSCSDLLTQR